MSRPSGLRVFGWMVFIAWLLAFLLLVFLLPALLFGLEDNVLFQKFPGLGPASCIFLGAVPVLWFLFIRSLNWHLPPEEEDLPVGDRMNIEEYMKPAHEPGAEAPGG